MFRNECLFLEGSLGDPEKRNKLSEKVEVSVHTETGVESYEMYNHGGLIVFEFVREVDFNLEEKEPIPDNTEVPLAGLDSFPEEEEVEPDVAFEPVRFAEAEKLETEKKPSPKKAAPKSKKKAR